MLIFSSNNKSRKLTRIQKSISFGCRTEKGSAIVPTWREKWKIFINLSIELGKFIFLLNQKLLLNCLCAVIIIVLGTSYFFFPKLSFYIGKFSMLVDQSFMVFLNRSAKVSSIGFYIHCTFRMELIFSWATIFLFKDPPKAFDDFKNKQKNVWSNFFWYEKVCIFWRCIQ